MNETIGMKAWKLSRFGMVIGVTVFLAGNVAYAGSSGLGTVSQLITYDVASGTNLEGVAFFTVSSGHDNRPAQCPNLLRWAIDLGRASGRAQYATVLAAYLSGRQISVLGTNDCHTWSDTESVSFIRTDV